MAKLRTPHDLTALTAKQLNDLGNDYMKLAKVYWQLSAVRQTEPKKEKG